jgi:hypothetical protein
MVIDVPTGPEAGEKELMVGCENKFCEKKIMKRNVNSLLPNTIKGSNFFISMVAN